MSSKFVCALCVLALTGCGAAAVVGGSAPSVGGVNMLTQGGSAANFGSHAVTGGFVPDPMTVQVVSGGPLAVSDQGISASNSGSCRGHVTPTPDVIVDYTNPAGFLRFYMTANIGGTDTTLVIRDPQGRWFCSDDDGGNLQPMIDMQGPAAGHYDVWVGSYSSSEQIQGTLHITELDSNRP